MLKGVLACRGFDLKIFRCFVVRSRCQELATYAESMGFPEKTENQRKKKLKKSKKNLLDKNDHNLENTTTQTKSEKVQRRIEN